MCSRTFEMSNLSRQFSKLQTNNVEKWQNLCVSIKVQTIQYNLNIINSNVSKLLVQNKRDDDIHQED